MIIPETIPTHWHENHNGDKLVLGDDCGVPPGFVFSTFRTVMTMQDSTFVEIRQQEVK